MKEYVEVFVKPDNVCGGRWLHYLVKNKISMLRLRFFSIFTFTISE